MKIFKHIPYNRWDINRRNTKFHAQFRFDLHSFDQNILSNARVTSEECLFGISPSGRNPCGGNKIWLSMHPRNFGCDKIVRPHVHSFHSYRMWNVKLSSWESEVLIWLLKIHVIVNWQLSMKIGYPMTSVTWLHPKLRCTIHWGDVFFKFSSEQLLVI